MAVLRSSEVQKMSKKEREDKLKALRLELTKANVSANRANAKTKEIKRAIARILTFNKSDEEALKKR